MFGQQAPAFHRFPETVDTDIQSKQMTQQHEGQLMPWDNKVPVWQHLFKNVNQHCCCHFCHKLNRALVHVCRGEGQNLYLTFFGGKHRLQKFPPGQGQASAAVEGISAAGKASALTVQVRSTTTFSCAFLYQLFPLSSTFPAVWLLMAWFALMWP